MAEQLAVRISELEPLSAPAQDPEQVLVTIAGMIVEVIGEEYVLDLDIGMDTTFNADLELESIEFVAMAAKLRDHYGERVDFVALLADKEVDEIISLTVGELVTYIVKSLAD